MAPNRQTENAVQALAPVMAKAETQAVARFFDSTTKFRRIRNFSKVETGKLPQERKKFCLYVAQALPYRGAAFILQCNKYERRPA
jgi:hypothetical protein